MKRCFVLLLLFFAVYSYAAEEIVQPAFGHVYVLVERAQARGEVNVTVGLSDAIACKKWHAGALRSLRDYRDNGYAKTPGIVEIFTTLPEALRHNKQEIVQVTVDAAIAQLED